MTHDELLVHIIGEIQAAEFEYACGDGNNPRVAKALRAVVELHKTLDDGLTCHECTASETEWYPCPTIQAIEKELV